MINVKVALDMTLCFQWICHRLLAYFGARSGEDAARVDFRFFDQRAVHHLSISNKSNDGLPCICSSPYTIALISPIIDICMHTIARRQSIYILDSLKCTQLLRKQKLAVRNGSTWIGLGLLNLLSPLWSQLRLAAWITINGSWDA